MGWKAIVSQVGGWQSIANRSVDQYECELCARKVVVARLSTNDDIWPFQRMTGTELNLVDDLDELME